MLLNSLAALALADAADAEVLAEADALAALDPELPAQPASASAEPAARAAVPVTNDLLDRDSFIAMR